MKSEILELLRCPVTAQKLHCEGAVLDNGEIEAGWLIAEGSGYRYPIHGGIPRFVPESNYADSFGLQWNRFRRTQLDSHSGHPISTERFWAATGWLPDDLRGRWVLDVGCGAGRFAEVALRAGAKVVALDYSRAVDACRANLKHHPNLHVVQGNVYHLPFEPGSFSFVYSLGVLQHTPDVAGAFAALPAMLHEGGRLCVDCYEKSWKALLHPKYLLRPLSRHLPQQTLFNLLERWIPMALPVSRGLRRVPGAGPILSRGIPVANYEGSLPLSEEQLKEWALLDTFDWLAPRYDRPQSARTLRRWMEGAGMREIEVLNAGHLVTRGRR